MKDPVQCALLPRAPRKTVLLADALRQQADGHQTINPCHGCHDTWERRREDEGRDLTSLGAHRDRAGCVRSLEILRQRYARGEINKDEFEAKKKDLGG